MMLQSFQRETFNKNKEVYDMSDNLEKMKNEYIYERMNQKDEDEDYLTPLIISIWLLLTFGIIITWMMFLLK